jgi:hypothetical protein
MLYSGRFWPFRQTSDQDGKACKGRDKHSSVLQKIVNYGRKKFYNIVPCYSVFLPRNVNGAQLNKKLACLSLTSIKSQV